MGKTSAGYRRMYVVGTVTPMKKLPQQRQHSPFGTSTTAALSSMALTKVLRPQKMRTRRISYEEKFIFLDEN